VHPTRFRVGCIFTSGTGDPSPTDSIKAGIGFVGADAHIRPRTTDGRPYNIGSEQIVSLFCKFLLRYVSLFAILGV